jgi:hypothetical protein
VAGESRPKGEAEKRELPEEAGLEHVLYLPESIRSMA